MRIFRKTHKEIQKGAGIGSRNTIIDGVRHLVSIGLVKVTSSVGVSDGNEYEIFTPDETGYTGISGISGIISIIGTSGTTDSSSITETSQNLVIPVQPLSGISGITQLSENKTIYDDTKTSLKTIENHDDDVFAEMIKILT